MTQLAAIHPTKTRVTHSSILAEFAQAKLSDTTDRT